MINIGRKCGKAIDSLASGMGNLSGYLLLIISFVTFYEVIMRRVFHSPSLWALEVSIFLFIWFVFLALAYVKKEERHVAVDLIICKFPPRTRVFWDIVISVVFLLFACLLTYFSIGYVGEALTKWQYTSGMVKLPHWIIKIAILLGSTVLVTYLIREIIAKIHALLTQPLEKGKGLWSKPALPAIMFFGLLAIGLCLLKINGAIGSIILVITMLMFGVPIFPGLGLVGSAGIFLLFGGTQGLLQLPNISYATLDNYAWVCIPLFILCGQILSQAGVGEEIYYMCEKWFGRLPGGLGVATIAACTVFAAISTSSVATAATIGSIAIPALLSRKYDPPLAYGAVAAGGTLGIMIPPAGAMIVYSAVTEESLGKLFLAGLIPGLVLSALFSCYIVWYCIKNKRYQMSEPATWQEKFGSLKKAAWGLACPVIILGGIYSGVFTPLEAGGASVVYSILMLIARRIMRPRELFKSAVESVQSGAMVLSIVIGAMVFGYLITLLRLPNTVVEMVRAADIAPWSVIVILMLFLAVLGMFLEVISIMLITLPVMYPLIISLGYDGIWFAVMLTLNMEMCLLTPPVGLNLFVIQGIARTSLAPVLRGVTPFLIIMVLGLVLFYFVPQLSLWLPSMMIR